MPEGITLPRTTEVHDAFRKGEIGWQEAFDRLKKLPKPWATPEWRAYRKKHIGNECEQCGADEGPLVLQHLAQPPPFNELRRAVRRHLWDEEVRVGLLPEPQEVERDVCPKCTSPNIYFLKREGRWRCNRTRKGRRICEYHFDTPDKETLPDVKGNAARKQAVYEEWRARTDEQVSHLAFDLSIQFHERYVSMEDVVTFCKRCAFLADQLGLEPCECGKHRPVGVGVCIHRRTSSESYAARRTRWLPPRMDRRSWRRATSCRSRSFSERRRSTSVGSFPKVRSISSRRLFPERCAYCSVVLTSACPRRTYTL
ncbi:MAG: hypothetical protein AAGI52_02600 [Bacteroidota bacterium]